MKTLLSIGLLLSFALTASIAQSPCSLGAHIDRLTTNGLTDAKEEIGKNEFFIQEQIRRNRNNRAAENDTATYTIPVVLHVFHNGDDAKIDTEQALSGLQILNDDFNGLNDAWDQIDAQFDSIKASLSINFCLATLDPSGNPTSGILYHEDPLAIYNEGNPFQYAWNNQQYLNIYLPKYAFGDSSDFTAYAYYPDYQNVLNNTDGVFYSSIRWGYGTKSILEEGHDWASVISHEVGHWLNLAHTFEDACFGVGDQVDDTPRTDGGTIFPEGCYNYDMSCGVSTNGSNFMDYNHGCKRMFTKGQVERMEAALYLPSRSNLWTTENLIATGCMDMVTNTEVESIGWEVEVFPNPGNQQCFFRSSIKVKQIALFDAQGKTVLLTSPNSLSTAVDVSHLPDGIYFYQLLAGKKSHRGKLVLE